MNALLRPPWSDQPLRRSVRVLAWLFVACGLVTIGLVIHVIILNGMPPDLPLKVYVLFGGVLYMTALVLSSAIHGKAPHGWIPWEAAGNALHDDKAA
jgi:drug/metabolite transporter superfamily protein YnfA